jgi:hypothetical protein
VRGATPGVVRAAAAFVAILPLAGCGAQAPDLFAVQRSGQGPNAKLRMVVNDGGTVTCNGKEHPLPDQQLLKARDLARQLGDQAQLHLVLPPGPNSVLAYQVRLQAGTVRFADSSADLPPDFTALELFTKDVAEDVCGLTR